VKFNVLILLKETFFFFDSGIRTEKETTLLHEVLNILPLPRTVLRNTHIVGNRCRLILRYFVNLSFLPC